MEILTGEQMRRVDRRAIEGLGIASLVLMESAGREVAMALLRDEARHLAEGVTFLCGRGNNGGDGLVAARHLLRAGKRSRVLLFARKDEVTGDAAIQLAAAEGSGLTVEEVQDEARWEVIRAGITGGVFVDALLGTGVRGGVRGILARVIEDLCRFRSAGARVVAIDLPSGLDADVATLAGPAVLADRTYTLCRPKLPLVLEPAATHAGTWSVLPIGIPDDAVAAEKPQLEWLDGDAVKGLLPPRPASSHKGTFGHLLIVAGSRSKPGAAALVARAALRSGVGLATVATSASAQAMVAALQAEVMTEALREGSSGALSREAAGRALRLLDERDALAIGPGLGSDPSTREAILRILERRKVPAVVDADALNAFPGRTRGARRASLPPHTSPTLLTPHPGEAARLLGTTVAEIQADRLAAARRLAAETGAVVVLKGNRSVVARPDGVASLNASGNPGMATAGAGDLLTGILGALLARGMDAADAARLGVFAHGDAGDRAARDRGQEGMIAADILERLPAAIEAVCTLERTRRW